MMPKTVDQQSRKALTKRMTQSKKAEKSLTGSTIRPTSCAQAKILEMVITNSSIWKKTITTKRMIHFSSKIATCFTSSGSWSRSYLRGLQGSLSSKRLMQAVRMLTLVASSPASLIQISRRVANSVIVSYWDN